jgi:hypothetical protein
VSIKMKVPGVAHAKRVRPLLDSHADRQKKHEARLDLRKRIRDHGIATTARMDRERLSNIRADVPLTARSAQGMLTPRTSTPQLSAANLSPRSSLGMVPPRTSSPRPMRVNIAPPRGARSAASRSVSSAGATSSGSAMSVGSRVGSSGSVASLVAKFAGLGYPGGYAPAKRPARMQRDLSNYKR